MIENTNLLNLFNSPVRYISAWVEQYDSSTLAATYKATDALQSFTIERVGDNSGFFGYGICQKLNVKLRDMERAIAATTQNHFEIVFDDQSEQGAHLFPHFKVTEAHRDENTNALSITAYDALYWAKEHSITEILPSLSTAFTIAAIARLCAETIGLKNIRVLGANTAFFKSYTLEQLNVEGTETIKDVLDDIAEATQTIYYLNNTGCIVFKRLGAVDSVLTIDKEKYFTLESRENRRLNKIVHATELGDNVEAAIDATGTAQYIRDNMFWELREDIDTIVTEALAAVGGFTIHQFTLDWRGNPLVELGDQITLEAKDGSLIGSCFVLDDVIEYNGALKGQTQWSYNESGEETANNPATLGAALKQTFARVDKANKQINLVASETSANTENIGALQINTESINASVSGVEERVNGINDSVEKLTESVNLAVTKDNFSIEVKKVIESEDIAANKVETTKGFTFNEDGLTITSSDSHISTQITENGMTVSADNEAVLTADNEGVEAVNLYASTWLIIGNNARLQNYKSGRTACFWIGD